VETTKVGVEESTLVSKLLEAWEELNPLTK